MPFDILLGRIHELHNNTVFIISIAIFIICSFYHACLYRQSIDYYSPALTKNIQSRKKNQINKYQRKNCCLLIHSNIKWNKANMCGTTACKSYDKLKKCVFFLCKYKTYWKWNMATGTLFQRYKTFFSIHNMSTGILFQRYKTFSSILNMNY